jgi:lysophospholipase
MSFFQSRDGTQLHEETWPATGKPTAAVVIIHGYGEHIGRYDETGRALAAAGFSVRGRDLRGHGQSGGVRGFCNRFDEYLDDVDAIVTRARAEGLPVFILAHSFGALVAPHYVLRHPTNVAGLVLTSPFWKLALAVPPLKVLAGKIASTVYPKLALPAGLKGADVARDPEIAAKYDVDPLNNKNATARWFTESSAARRRRGRQGRGGAASARRLRAPRRQGQDAAHARRPVPRGPERAQRNAPKNGRRNRRMVARACGGSLGSPRRKVARLRSVNYIDDRRRPSGVVVATCRSFAFLDRLNPCEPGFCSVCAMARRGAGVHGRRFE